MGDPHRTGKNVVVIGPGRMGQGIALAFALRGTPVTLVDVKERPDDGYAEMVGEARRQFVSNMKLLGKVGYTESTSRDVLPLISFRRGIAKEHLRGGCIFEALPEKPDLKIRLFRDISPLISPKTIVASATSTIDIKTMAQGLTHPERLLTTHWLNPAFIIPVVEVARGQATDDRVVRRVTQLLKGIGKKPVVLRDSPGFIIPRIQAGAMNEAVRILEEGIATADQIDTATKYGFGFRLSAFGLLEFIDMGGLDILYYADAFLFSKYKAERFKAPKLIDEKMKKGETGPRTGKGIYDYRGENVKLRFERRYRTLINVLGAMEEKPGRRAR